MTRVLTPVKILSNREDKGEFIPETRKGKPSLHEHDPFSEDFLYFTREREILLTTFHPGDYKYIHIHTHPSMPKQGR